MGPCGAQHSSMNLRSVLLGPTFALGFNSDLCVIVVTLCLCCPSQQCGLGVLVWENFAGSKVTTVAHVLEPCPALASALLLDIRRKARGHRGLCSAICSGDESCCAPLQVLGTRWGVNGLMCKGGGFVLNQYCLLTAKLWCAC